MSRICTLVLVLFLGAGVTLASAQQAEVDRVQIAYIVGNKDYQFLRSLRSTQNDAEDIAEAISFYGFEFRLELNQTVDEFDSSFGALIDDLTQARNEGSLVDVFFYFAGHGVEISGRNHLLPVDFRPPNSDRVTERALERQAIALDDVLRELSASSHRVILVLDSCRDDPFPDENMSARSIATARFASPPNLAVGTLVFYCAGLNQIARDFLPTDDLSARTNGVCTRHLVNVLMDGVATFESAANEVQGRVYESTLPFFDPPQTPAIYDQLVRSYVMNGNEEYGEVAAALTRLGDSINSSDASLAFLDNRSGTNGGAISAYNAGEFELFASDFRGAISEQFASTDVEPLLGSNMTIYFRPDRLESAQAIANEMGSLGVNMSVVSTDLSEIAELPPGTNRIVSLDELSTQEEQVLSAITQVLDGRVMDDLEPLEVTRVDALRSGPVQIQLY